MAKNRGAVVIDTERCKGCQLCKEACPSKVLSMNIEANSKGYHYAYMEVAEACTGCASCAYVCPDACITVYRVKND
jgi:2-oxoglutarate ferredoxin oxidoreductase subunit delta